MHISDIEGEYIPRKGDKVKFRLCPMPPKFDKFQAVHIQIVDFTPEVRFDALLLLFLMWLELFLLYFIHGH